jgi:hypothetical protein
MLVKNDTKKEKKETLENKVSLSLREFSKAKILFRLVNNKRENSKSFNIYEKAKFSSNIENAFNNDYRKIDIEYDTTKNNRFKKVNLLVDINSYLDREKKSLYLDLINSNKKYIKENNISNKDILENKVSLSLREFSKAKILFRLVNNKRENTKSFNIYEKAKFSTNIENAFNNDYRKIDIEYDTTKNNRFKKVNLLVDINSYLDKDKKNLYLDLLNSNKKYIKENNISNKDILENINYFEKKINELK